MMFVYLVFYDNGGDCDKLQGVFMTEAKAKKFILGWTSLDRPYLYVAKSAVE